MIYQDKRGHFTSEENNGGECPHNNLQKLSIDELKTLSQIEIDKENFADFIQKKRNKEYTARKYIVTNISMRQRNAIEKLIGEELRALHNTISIDEVKHIENRHGLYGEHDRSMATIDDYKDIVEVLHKFDSFGYVYDKNGNIKTSKKYMDKYNKPAKLIYFKKHINNKIAYVVEMVTDGASRDIKILSSYKEKDDI